MAFVSFWILPVISAFVWIGMLLAMLITWLVQGSPHYASMDPGQHIAYISDIGAQFLKPLFIAGCAVTTVFLDLSFAAERWLRHTGHLAKNTTRAEKVLSSFAIFFAVCGTAGLILLSIFDTLRHPKLHDGFLLLFIAGYIISAIFICAEYQRLGIHFRQHRVLRLSFWIKLAFILVELALAIAFASLTFTGNTQVGAVFEWIIALVFTFWVLSFLIDLLPAVRAGRHENSAGAPQIELGNGNTGKVHSGTNEYTHGTNGYTNGYMNGTNSHAVNEATYDGNASTASTAYGDSYATGYPAASEHEPTTHAPNTYHNGPMPYANGRPADHPVSASQNF